MKEKKPKAKKKQRATKASQVKIVFEFPSGPMPLSLVEFEYQLLLEASKLVTSDDLGLRELGTNRLRQAAKRLAEVAFRHRVVNSNNASRPREMHGRTSALQQAIQDEKQAGITKPRKIAAKVAADWHVSPQYVRRLMKTALET